MYYLGIDIGSLSCDAVLIDQEERTLATSVVLTGARNQEAIARATAEVMTKAGLTRDKISAIVSTGYGREQVKDRNHDVTEITCHARGITKLCPGTRVLIDIGGQDSKAIFLNTEGRVMDFAMNDKCAAGTGRFLEAMARVMQIDLNELAALDTGALGHVTISSMCTVFAESEVVSLIAGGVPVNEIAHGLNRAIATRTITLVKRVAPDLKNFPIAMSGGVALNSGVLRALSSLLGKKISVPQNPETVGALGAALIAREKSR
ncbi:MAG: 2-hydroxyglutaryl-CoA dehydratase [Deltaproteobacteria bacterium]|nr:2-hydroxyglutaryl-CoA dehydratase [Deltaproteobacteria bacterium]